MFNVVFDTYFVTFTCFNWHRFLTTDACKLVVLDSFKHMVLNDGVRIYGFVIMPNHVHVIWSMAEDKLEYVRNSFTKATGHRIVKLHKMHHPEKLFLMQTNETDRQYQCWMRRPFWKTVFYEKMFIQKLNYIHLNPVRKGWKLSENPEDYYYSSAKSYLEGIPEFEFLSLWGSE